MHGLTTIAAFPRTGGAGMALRGETNTRPMWPIAHGWGHSPDQWGMFGNPADISNRMWRLCAAQQQSENLDSRVLGKPDIDLAQQQEEDRLSVLRAANLDCHVFIASRGAM